MTQPLDPLSQPISSVARADFATLKQDLTIQQAFDLVRQHGLGEKIIYFYVVDADGRLTGVLPVRRLLTAALDQRVADCMISRVVTLRNTATVMDACEMFAMHKFMALPVVDEDRRVVGVVDVNLMTTEVFDVAERDRMDEVFEAVGFRVTQIRDASPFRAFGIRFPWLLATIASGTLCAVLAGTYELTLAKSLVLAFFLTLVLGLSESVSIQTMTVTIQALRTVQPNLRWYFNAIRRELGSALMLGIASGLLVGLIVWLWRGTSLAALSIGGSISLSLCTACFFGLTVPTILHAFKLDPKIAAGPVTLGLTDIFALLFYFNLASLLL